MLLFLFVCEQVLNKLEEFEDAVRKAVKDVRLDNDVVVSVFETNIRVLGYETYGIYLVQFCIVDIQKVTCLVILVA